MQPRVFYHAVVAFIAIVQLGFAQEHKGVSYKLPSGWQEGIEGDAKVFAPKSLKDGELVAVILTPASPATSETPAKQFDTVVASANAESKIVAKGDVESKSDGGNTVCIQAFQLDAPEVGKHSRIYAMIVSPKQRVLVMVIIKPDALADKYTTDIMALIGSIKLTSGSKPVKPEEVGSPATGKTPTGDTPDKFPGQEGWLPSGRGVKIPPADLVSGKPQGLWWSTSFGSSLVQKAMTFAFLPGGAYAAAPRFGGGNLIDIEGQKAQAGATAVGTFSISGGKITRDYDGFHHVEPYTTGSDASGEFFKIGGATYRPLSAPTKKQLIGIWKIPGTQYVFSEDGTYAFGQVNEVSWVPGSTQVGTYTLDGYLVTLKNRDGRVTVIPVGMASKSILVLFGMFFKQ